jgi:hypothetical protein
VCWQDDQKLLELVYSLDLAQVEGLFSAAEGRQHHGYILQTRNRTCAAGQLGQVVYLCQPVALNRTKSTKWPGYDNKDRTAHDSSEENYISAKIQDFHEKFHKL